MQEDALLTGDLEYTNEPYAISKIAGMKLCESYNIQYGTRAFIRRLEKLGIKHHFEEFDGSHSGMDWRLDTSLPMLAKALCKDEGADSPR